MSLRGAYTVWAPIYDPLLARTTHKLREQSLARLTGYQNSSIALLGVGTGLDFPYLPADADNAYVGIDLTPAMLERATKRAKQLQLPIDLIIGDVHRLPLADASFEAVVLHLILAVVPEPIQCLREAVRIARPGARILILDKFLKPGRRAPIRRLINPFLQRLATRTDVVFEDILGQLPELRLINDQPVAAGGWFRAITLERTA